MAASDDAAQREAYVEQIQRQFDLMAGMTREVLAFARGDTDLVVRKVYVNRFVEELATQLGAATAGRNIDFKLEAKYDGIAYFDEQKLLRVFHNLRATRSRRCRRAVNSRSPSIARTNTCCGRCATPAPASRRSCAAGCSSCSRPASKGGTGLGLAIVKKIVDDHHGTIAVETGTDGTNFVLKLPLQRPTDGD